MRSRGKRLRLNRPAKSQGHAFLEYGVFERYEYASRRLALCKNVTSSEVQICVSSNHNDEGPNRAFWTTMPILRRSSLGKFYPPRPHWCEDLDGTPAVAAAPPNSNVQPIVHIAFEREVIGKPIIGSMPRGAPAEPMAVGARTLPDDDEG